MKENIIDRYKLLEYAEKVDAAMIGLGIFDRKLVLEENLSFIAMLIKEKGIKALKITKDLMKMKNE